MKISKFVAVIAAVVACTAMIGTSTSGAAVNSVTPSTNDINANKGWAHVDVHVTQGQPHEFTLTFVSTRNFYSCFEYRTNSGRSQAISRTNFNGDITDGLYPYVCVADDTTTRTITAAQRVEVRMVFGAERDERFDWTRFDANDPTVAQP